LATEKYKNENKIAILKKEKKKSPPPHPPQNFWGFWANDSASM
jgi:hypothetical protein